MKDVNNFIFMALLMPLAAMFLFVIAAAMVGYIRQKSKLRDIRRLCSVCIRLYMKPKEIALLVPIEKCVLCKSNKRLDTR